MFLKATRFLKLLAREFLKFLLLFFFRNANLRLAVDALLNLFGCGLGNRRLFGRDFFLRLRRQRLGTCVFRRSKLGGKCHGFRVPLKDRDQSED